MKTHPAMERELDLYHALYERFYRPVRVFLSDRMDDAETAGELAQEVFIKLYRFLDRVQIAPHLSSLEDRVESLSGWIFTVARNVHRDWWRGVKWEQLHVRPIEADEEFQQSERTEMALATERRQYFERWLSSLKAQHQEAVQLWLLGGYTFEQISTQMGVSLSAVKGWMHQLRKQVLADLSC